MPSTLIRVDTCGHDLALHDTAGARRLEARALARSPDFSLMRQAGQDAARWALAWAPHAQRIWIAAGPGNNGGDGLVAATVLHRAGKTVHVTWLGDAARAPADARRAHAEALAAGVPVQPDLPPWPCELAIDALLGLGQCRAPEGRIAALVQCLNTLAVPVLALDLPTGLCADTGQPLGEAAVQAGATLSLLSLKPGLFTAQGRRWAGEVWLSDLGWADATEDHQAALTGIVAVSDSLALRDAPLHKGSFGDLWVLGGAAGMAGAARLAAQAALAAGAGRVYVCRLDGEVTDDPIAPELMHRTPPDLTAAMTSGSALTVVAGCGGGQDIAAALPALIHRATRLVLDADALNALAESPALAELLVARGGRSAATVLTPHPLEAARLLGLSSAEVQADRLRHAQALAERFGATVILKGSGSVIATAGRKPHLNPTGNARLGTAGTGDVLSGWLGGLWSAQPWRDEPGAAHRAARTAAWLHGKAAEQAPTGAHRLPLTARHLIDRLAELTCQLPLR